MQRREFLKLGATLSAVTLLPSWSRFAFAQTNTPSLAIPPQISPDKQQRLFLISNKVFPSLLLLQVRLLGGITVAY